MKDDRLNELQALQRMARHFIVWASAVVEKDSEVLEAAQMLNFTLYRELVDAHGGLPPTLQIRSDICAEL